MTNQTSVIQHEIKTALKTFGLLAALVFLTVVRSYLHISLMWSILIEGVKIGIVVGYFLHLSTGKKLIHMVWALTIIFAFGFLLIPLARFDVLKGSEDISLKLQKQEKPPVEEPHVH